MDNLNNIISDVTVSAFKNSAHSTLHRKTAVSFSVFENHAKTCFQHFSDKK